MERLRGERSSVRRVEVASTMDYINEGCISWILSRTTPRDACRSAAVCSIFRSASESDIVWKSFLPSDYEEIISRSVSPSLADLSSRKELYFRLCDTPLLIEGRNLSFGLEKWSGKKCYMMGARELGIMWGDTPIYWKWTSLPESRFAEVAEVVSVCWLKIRGKMDTGKLSPKTNYAAYFVFKIMEADHGWEGDLGFNYVPAGALVRFTGGGGGGGGGDGEQREVFLGRHRESNREMEAEVPKKRSDGWLEIEMGEFFNDQGEDEVEMSLLELKGLYWKAGLVVEGIELRPKESK